MREVLAELVAGRTLSAERMIEVFRAIMSGEADPVQVGALLALVQSRGVTEDELFGGAAVMREKMVPVQAPAGAIVLDTCSTGGTHAKTFNISTTAALIVAAVGREKGGGVVVAKHGNRSVTSTSGSSQVLALLGYPMDPAPGPEDLAKRLSETGFCFCFAQAHHPAMKHVGPVRGALGFRTMFNLLGPLTNPAGASRQVMGVYDASLLEPMARVMGRLGKERAMVLHTTLADGRSLNELVTAGPAELAILKGGKVRRETLDTAALGLAVRPLEAIEIDSPEQSAAMMRSVFANEPGPALDTAVLNAAAGLLVTELAGSFEEGIVMAKEAVACGDVGMPLG